MNIDGLGEKITEEFIRLGYLYSIIDIYKLRNVKDELIALKGFKEKSVNKLLSSIEKSKHVSLDKLLTALGIRFVGSKIAKQLANHFGSLEGLSKASLEDFLAIDEVGERIANSVANYFNAQQTLIYDLISLGINPVVEKKDKEHHVFCN